MKLKKSDLKELVVEALTLLDRPAPVVEVAKALWETHEDDLRDSGDLFFTWQYDMRWAAQALRDEGKLVHADRKWALK